MVSILSSELEFIMKLRTRAILLVLILVSSISLGPVGRRFGSEAIKLVQTPAAKQELNSLAHLPMTFEENEGQTDKAVKFLSRGPGYTFFLTPNEAVMSLAKSAGSDEEANPAVVRMRLEGANNNPVVSGVDEIATRSNYLIGGKKPLTDVSHFSKVKYSGVYPGVDLVWYGQEDQLEYDWIVSPGADPNQIKLGFAGIESLTIDENGDLVISSPSGELRQKQPVIYQEKNGSRELVEGRYVLKGENEVGFALGSYDSSRPLIIDPYLYFSTYFGGSGYSAGYNTVSCSIAVDNQGYIYVAGTTASSAFPVYNAGQSTYGGVGYDSIGDGFILKLAPNAASVVFATYLGGSLDDEIFAISVAPDGGIVVGGDTASNNFPLKNAYQSTFAIPTTDSYHGFVSKLTADGQSLSWSTFLGGSSYEDSVSSVTTDASGNVYFVGYTNSTNFPRVNALYSVYQGGSYDGFIGKISSDGTTPGFITFFGGSGVDAVEGIDVDSTGIYVQGITLSGNLPLVTPFQTSYAGAGADGTGDAFVAKFALDGSSLVYSSFLGGSGDDQIYGIRLGTDHSLYVCGDTSSANFPLKNAYSSAFAVNTSNQYHAFVSRVSPTGQLAYSTYFGGAGQDSANSIAVDAAGAMYITGITTSNDLPVTGALQATYSGNYDSYVGKFDPTGASLLFLTYMGGTNTDEGYDLSVDGAGNIYGVGVTNSTDLPTRSALQATDNGQTNLFIFKLGADEVTVGAANFSLTAIAGKALASAFGPNLANATATVTTPPLPTVLGGTTVKVKDSTGTERLAPLFFVSPGQVNYQIPAGTASGPAFITITTGSGFVSTGVMTVLDASPAVFTLNQSGSGAAAALDAITFAGSPFNAKRSTGEANILAFYGTGFGQDITDQNGDASGSVTCLIDGQPASVLYAGRAPGYIGLNQLNILLPTGITSGTHTIVFSRSGSTSNTTTFDIK